MRILLLISAFYSFTLWSQNVIPFLDFNNYFKVFQDGAFRQLEFQLIEEYKASDEFVAYVDNRGNLRVYDGKNRKDLANTNVEYTLSDHYLTWKIATTLNMWDAGFMQTLTYNCGEYAVMDSMIVYRDLRYNNVTVYEKGQRNVAYQSTGDIQMPLSIGDNTFAFKDNGDFYKIYWNGAVTDIDVWVGKMDFSAGVDVVAFNDPNTRTFAVFDKGQIVDVEDLYARSFKAGRGFVVYEDQNGNLVKYQDGIKTTLSQFGASKYDVKDDVVVWMENGFFYMESKGKKWQVLNFEPEEYLLKNETLVFKNAMKGVSVSQQGKVTEVTNQMDAKFEIYGNSVLVRLFNSSFIVWQNGRKYTN